MTVCELECSMPMKLKTEERMPEEQPLLVGLYHKTQTAVVFRILNTTRSYAQALYSSLPSYCRQPQRG
jgi:hypothetical protein